MYTLITLFCCIGFFQLYNTSARAKLSASGVFEKWMQANPQIAKSTGLLLLLIGLTLAVVKNGWGLGICFFLMILMCAACYIVALAPLMYIRSKHLIMLVIVFFLLELTVFK